jgi:drug/metabolite transporter (DMT)-like permease
MRFPHENGTMLSQKAPWDRLFIHSSSEIEDSMKNSLPILFALGTAICWGLYGPTIANARSPEKLWSPFKPYVGIGLAYIVWAFVGGLIVMWMKGDSFSFSGKHSAAGIWGFAAGTLGALGALSLTAAMISFVGKPKPQLVMPIVFGGAVTVSAIVSFLLYRGESKTSPWLWVGIVGMAVCIVLVAYNTPHGHPPKKPGAETPATTSVGGSSSVPAEPSS